MKFILSGLTFHHVIGIYGHNLNKEEDAHGYIILEFERFIELLVA